jgi:pimeloyl-ACP methyl ester carboxylesterase
MFSPRTSRVPSTAATEGDLSCPRQGNRWRESIAGCFARPTSHIAEREAVAPSSRTTAGIAYDRAGPRGDLPVILLHAGVADRRMWDSLWSALAVERDVVRLDLRGFGESTARPRGMLSPVDDVLNTLAEAGIDRSHLVGASFGAAVAVEAALTRPRQVASLLLSPRVDHSSQSSPRTCAHSSRPRTPRWRAATWAMP